MKRMIGFIVFVFVFVNSAVAGENKIRLIMPPAIYSVVGHETNLYFDNVILVPNVKNYLFDVNCGKGRQDSTRWWFIPDNKDVGQHSFNLKTIDGMNKVISEGASNIYVSPANAGEGKDISILVVGDSLTFDCHYPHELKRLFQTQGNPKVRFVGSHTGVDSRKPDGEQVLREGRGGWTWASYCTWPGGPFLFMKEGKPQLDFQMYCNKYNKGKAPDFITIFLGCNDVFGCNEGNINGTIDGIFKSADTLISEFRKVSKTTQIGMVLLVPPAGSQDAFGSGYTCNQTRWQYRRNQHLLVARMIKTYGDRKKENISLIPAYINIDCVNNFPKGQESLSSRNTGTIVRDQNGVHPAKEGYYQIADSIYGWLKYQLNLVEQTD